MKSDKREVRKLFGGDENNLFRHKGLYIYVVLLLSALCDDKMESFKLNTCILFY